MPDFLLSLWDGLNPSQLQYFHFLRPWWLLFAVPAYFFYSSMIRERDQLAPWRDQMSTNMIHHLTISGNTRQLLSPRKLFIPFAILSTLVLAGPSWQQQLSPFLEDESVLIIALDLSDSMHKNDIQPSRLLRAKQKINELTEIRGNARTALIGYAGSAHIAMPVTRDREMIRHFLDVLDTDLIPLKVRNPQSVLPQAEKLLRRTRSPGTLLLLTDDTTDGAIDAYQQFFANRQHQLLVWAIGETESDGFGTQPGIGSVQLKRLSQLSDAGNGRLIHFSQASDDVTRVNRYINNNLVVAKDSAQPWYDAGYPLLFLLAALQLTWFRRGWTLQW